MIVIKLEEELFTRVESLITSEKKINNFLVRNDFDIIMCHFFYSFFFLIILNFERCSNLNVK